ncbi:LAMI_0G00320g1_1 [Lachancea mirantina]|uniref:LAMI_0G00320g1_1 n=1 Tax=Lachancea mirantina TaxID=1230905 RepID=A0A1G4K723_9SACH|nr:LAMI_0G00320g1_1 [Lachancea mirantina]
MDSQIQIDTSCGSSCTESNVSYTFLGAGPTGVATDSQSGNTATNHNTPQILTIDSSAILPTTAYSSSFRFTKTWSRDSESPSSSIMDKASLSTMTTASASSMSDKSTSAAGASSTPNVTNSNGAAPVGNWKAGTLLSLLLLGAAI